MPVNVADTKDNSGESDRHILCFMVLRAWFKSTTSPIQ